MFVVPGSSADSALTGLKDDDFIVQHSVWDLLPDYALVALAQAATIARRPTFSKAMRILSTNEANSLRPL